MMINGQFVLEKMGNQAITNPWDRFMLRNPQTKRLLFFNAITKEIYISAFTYLQSGFNAYLNQQRRFRWEVSGSFCLI